MANATFDVRDDTFEDNEVRACGFMPRPALHETEEDFFTVHYCIDGVADFDDLTPQEIDDLEADDVLVLAVTDYFSGEPIPLCDLKQYFDENPDWDVDMAETALDEVRTIFK